MNFLAHAYLSGDSEEILVGNFIADFIRGNRYGQYSDDIIRGIHLHRGIDHFTDQHATVLEGIKRLRPVYGKYSSVVIDVFYDHFLAKNWNTYHDHSLEEHTQYVYGVFSKHKNKMPERIQNFLPSMIQDDWLVNYGEFHGIERALQRISERAKFQNNMVNAVETLKKEYKDLDKEFNIFFLYMIEYTRDFLSNAQG